MNKRLLDYLRSIGLAQDATDEQAWDYFRALRGMQASLANALNYDAGDTAARTNCDLMIRALGYDPANPKNLLPAENEPAPARTQTPGHDGASATGDLEAAEQRGAERERERVAAIRQFAQMAGTSDDLLRTLEGDANITIDQARQRIWEDHQARTRASVPADGPSPDGQAPAGHSRASQTDFHRDALACALMMREGIGDPTRAWLRRSPQGEIIGLRNMGDDERILRAADRGHELRRLSMVEIVRRCLELGGIRCEPTPESICRAMAERAATTSTAALTGIFTQTFGAVLLQAFETTRDTTMGWTIERENPNFLQNERHRMARGAALTKHAKGGRADDVEISEALTEYVKVFRYSGMFTIDEIDLINDSFGAQNDFTPQEMGEAARRLRPDLVYAILLANAQLADSVALFDASSHANLNTSAPLNKTNLQAALTNVSVQQENGINLNLEARYLIVPKILKFIARELVRSQTVIVAGNTDTVRPSANALVDEDLTVVSDSRLDNGVTDPNSGTTYAGDANDWYVAAPASRHTIETTYLAGSSRAPAMRSGVLDRGQFGIWFDVHQDIGAKALAYQGLCKNEG